MLLAFTILLVLAVLGAGFVWFIGHVFDNYIDPDIDDDGGW